MAVGEMGERIDALEKSISELIDQAGVDDHELEEEFEEPDDGMPDSPVESGNKDGKDPGRNSWWFCQQRTDQFISLSNHHQLLTLWIYQTLWDAEHESWKAIQVYR